MAENVRNDSLPSLGIGARGSFRSRFTPRARHRSATRYDLEKSQLSPPAHPSEDSSLAAILGFGEKQASLGSYQRERGGSNLPHEPVNNLWQDLPSLSSVTAELDRPGNTGDAVRLLWEATTEMDVDGELFASELSPVEYEFRSKRRVHWPMILGIVTLLTLMAVTAKVLTDLPARQTQEKQQQYAASAQQLHGSLASLEQTLTEGGLLSDSGLATLTDHLYTLDASARTASMLASQELPNASILGLRESVEELAAPRQQLESAAIQSLEISRRVGYAMVYSLSLSEALVLPDLPDEASPSETDFIAEELSLSIAEIQNTMGGLPDEFFFQPYLQEVSPIIATMEARQADYIAALRTGDRAAAARTGESLTTSIDNLRSGLRSPLGDIQSWAMGEIRGVSTTVRELETLIVT